MSVLSNVGLKIPPQRKRGEPVWRGPEVDGITFSLLSRFLTCRERFRVHAIEGLRPVEQFNHRIEYGNMWHACEEAYAANPDPIPIKPPCNPPWMIALSVYCRDLAQKYPMSRQDIEKWHDVCRIQFPIYVEYWSKHHDVLRREPMFQEQVFDVRYPLPSGREVRLRGKWDSVDLIGEGADRGIYLQENKTKGDIDEPLMRRQLTMDLQTMMYLVSLYLTPGIGYESEGHMASDHPPYPIRGVRYNVIRRPLSGGAGTIQQREATRGAKCSRKSCRVAPSRMCDACRGSGRVGAKPAETREQYMNRLRGYIDGTGFDSEGKPTKGPSWYFMRWKAEVSEADVERFRVQCLTPILEQLCDWYEYQVDAPVSEPIPPHIHWRHPFGAQNSIDEYGASDLDNYLATGSDAGLRQVDDLFPEL